MRQKVLNLLVVIASLFGYLEWGQDQSVFLFQAEIEVVARAFGDAAAVIHPFTLLPVLGQLALLVTLFQQAPSKALTYAGIAGIGLLLAFMFVIGVISLNAKIGLSTVPFLVFATLAVRAHRRQPG